MQAQAAADQTAALTGMIGGITGSLASAYSAPTAGAAANNLSNVQTFNTITAESDQMAEDMLMEDINDLSFLD